MRYTILVLIIIGSSYACKSTRHASNYPPPQEIPQPAAQQEGSGPVKFDYYEQSSWLLGFFEPGMMKREPHAAWFMDGFDNYTPSPSEMNKLKDLPTDGLSIKIIMGSWCPDSRREVPRFMRILDLWNFPPDKITFIGTDINKISPIGDYESLEIERVPTFIFYKNNIEAGRIIEVPKTSLEQDIVNVLTGNV